MSKYFLASPFQLCWLQHTFIPWSHSLPVCRCPWQTSHCSGTSTSWSLQCHLKFISNFIQWAPRASRQELQYHMSVLGFSLNRGRLQNPLLMFCPWLYSQNHTEDMTKIGCPLGVESGPPFELHLYTLSFVDAVLCGEISLSIFLSLIAWLVG